MERHLRRSPMPVPAGELFTWHGRPGALERLSPPWEPLEVRERTGSSLADLRLVARMRLGPLSLPMEARHRPEGYVEGAQFQDEMVRGPFAHWVHTHRMEPAGPRASTLVDDIAYALPLGFLGQLGGGWLVRDRLARMFAYRHALTRGDLERHAAFGPARLRIRLAGQSTALARALGAFLATGGHTLAGPGEPAEAEVRFEGDRATVTAPGGRSVAFRLGAVLGWHAQRRAPRGGPWIGLDDAVGALHFALSGPLEGEATLSADSPELARAAWRPRWPTPEAALAFELGRAR